MIGKLGAEFMGTFWLVLGGCGSAVLAAAFPGLGIGFVGVSLAFGLTVLTMAYAIGHISGCHLNPAVSFGLWAGGRFSGRELFGYIVAQLIDDDAQRTLAAASTLEADLRSGAATTSAAAKVGERLAQRAKDAGITTVVFDRGGNVYHGRVAALADAARQVGLEF